ncbi:P-loop containing nucleoside triphosphate hydrolase protein [Boeremia exigua]|uniref:P-loop containing nucleoside triphosphate hydrolase protein n=1 Tax=Boeremia exigua TaxID=749465 RepID=UPI001E8EE874|nr:P-loop containing nucleoside triphosphate hydrolase protein [Boeremia exigua]KAH6620490.1 P-loop containing nucleoside triphosphate hydrolase protein [Boeremia exigua]
MSNIANPSSSAGPSAAGNPPPAPSQGQSDQSTVADTVPAQQPAESQNEDVCMDADQSVTKVYAYGKTLPRELNHEILNMHPEQYTDKLAVGDLEKDPRLQVSTAGIFDLRGRDVNKSKLPQGLDGGQKLRTAIWFADNAPEDLIGAHLELSTEQAQAIEDDKEPPKIEPPRDECVKAKFHLDTQAPHIEISTFDPSTESVISTRIFADEIEWNFEHFSSDSPVEFYVRPYSREYISGMGKDLTKGLNGSWNVVLEMEKMTKHCVLMVSVVLRQPSKDRQWQGISKTALASIRAKPTNSVRDQLVTRFDETAVFSMCFSVKATAGMKKAWIEKFSSYFSRLVAITKCYGTFWFYRRQTEIALGTSDPDAMNDVDADKAIEKPAMPKVDFIVPRFLVKEWSVTETTNSLGEISYSDIKPHAWAPLEFPTQFPDANIAAFLLKLAIEEERAYQHHAINALVHSSGGQFFRGSYTHMVGKTYLVTIYLGSEKLSNVDVRLPSPGVRIQIKVDRKLNDPPQPETTATLTGMVIYTEDDANDVFTCVCDVQGPNLACANGRGDFATLIEYIIDELPFQRQMNAVSTLQRVSYAGQGPDVKSLLFDYQEPKEADVMDTTPLPTRRAAFEQALTLGFPFPPDKSQLRPCLDTFESETGMTVIVGPPGTGKTLTLTRIAFAMASLMYRVLCMGPTNASVHTLVDKFVEHNARLGSNGIADDDWVLFTGAHCRVGKAGNLRKRQTTEDQELERVNNLYAEYLRDAEDRRNHPRYQQTMGYKLGLKIRKWATDPSLNIETKDQVNLYQMSKKYVEVEENLPYIGKEEAKKARKDQLNREETLAYEFLRRVRFVFCTLSSSAHDMMLESGRWDEIIVDEAARETRAGIAVFLAAFHGRYNHITWSGDHMQGGGVVSGANANTGYNILVRNVFEQLVKVLTKTPDNPAPTGAFTLQTCHRMSGPLIKWSSDHCYGGQVHASPLAKQWNEPLRNTLRAFWAERLPDGFRGSYEQICFDVTGIDIASKQDKGSTSRYNVGEADLMAYWILELLEYVPPNNTAEKQCARVQGSDICVSSNFIDQVSQIRRHLYKRSEGKPPHIVQQVKDVLLMLETTGTIQGKERSISFYCTVIAVGHSRLAEGEDLPIGFVANVKSFNVSMTRQRVARYNFGAFMLFVQAIRDRRKVIHRYGEFFGYVNHMETSGFILSLAEIHEWMDKRQKIGSGQGFSNLLKAKATYKEEPVPKPAHKNLSGMHNADSRPTTTGNSNVQHQKAPATTKFGGKRDKNGNLLDQNKIQKSRGKRGGKKFKDDKRDPGGNDGAAGAAAAT